MRPQRSLRRTYDFRAPKQTFYVYSEGKNTEPEYFKNLNRYLTGAVVIEVSIISAAGAPKTIADKSIAHAIELKKKQKKKDTNSFEGGDSVWAVFDHDNHHDVPESIRRCRAADVQIGYSNPCFELWLMLHYQDFDGPDNHTQVQELLKGVSVGYDPAHRKTADWKVIIPQVENAERRADAMAARREKDGAERPFTTVQDLTRSIRVAHNAHRAGAA